MEHEHVKSGVDIGRRTSELFRVKEKGLWLKETLLNDYAWDEYASDEPGNM